MRKTPLVVLLLTFMLLIGCGFFQSTQPSPQVQQNDSLVSTAVAATVAVVNGNPVVTQGVPAAPQEPTPTLDKASLEKIFMESTMIAMSTQQASNPPVNPAAVLAFLDGQRNLWGWSKDKGLISLANTGDCSNPLLSPDGTMVVFVRNAESYVFSIWVVNIDGSGYRQLMGPADLNAVAGSAAAVGMSDDSFAAIRGVAPNNLSWVPQSHVIAFGTYPLFEGPGYAPFYDLWMIDADTDERWQLLPPGQGGDFTFAPDGSKIALAKPDYLSLINVDGSGRYDAVLKYPLINTASEYQYTIQPHWAGSATFLRVIVPPQEPFANIPQTYQVYHVTADGSPAWVLGTFQGLMSFRQAEISPDLARVAYLTSAGDSTSQIYELHIMNADGSNNVLYQSGGGLGFHSWSPDSQRFLFSMGFDLNSLYLGQVGVGAIPVDSSGSVRSLRWIDANQVAYYVPTATGWEVRFGVPGGATTSVGTVPGGEERWFDLSAVLQSYY